MIKRAFDCIAATAGLVLVSPLFVTIAVAIKLASPGPVFFRHRRIGRNFEPFLVWKFRTMAVDAAKAGPITWGGDADSRITRIGRVLRQTKLDELPQLLNVITGEMSLVGPRPEVEHYVELFKNDYREILQVRPGMTDLASLAFRDEAAVLAASANPKETYATKVLPEKIQLAKEYLRRSSLLFDLVVIARTLVSVVRKPKPA